MATDQITGSGDHAELLRALTDDQLDEQIKYYDEEWQKTDDRTAWEYSKLLSAAVRVRRERSAVGSQPSID